MYVKMFQIAVDASAWTVVVDAGLGLSGKRMTKPIVSCLQLGLT